MGKKIAFLSIILLMVVVGCTRKPTKTAQGYWDSAAINFEQRNYEVAVQEYEKIVKFYPQDDMAVRALFLVAEIWKSNLNNTKKAIDIYRKIISLYPDSDKAPNAAFMIGYIYANDVNDQGNARKYYEEFIKTYPDHALASSAQWELDNLGKTLEDIPQLNKLSEKEE